MPKIVFIGAGSTVFARALLGDILSFPELRDATIALHDIDAERLRTTDLVARQLALRVDASPTIEATLDRRDALRDADYVICMFQIGGYRPATVVDFEIPKRFGLRQTIGDTLGIGGIMRALRTIPVLLDLCRDMEMLCPDALLLNYVNPMAMNCWAISRASSIGAVGLCHSVQGTAAELARDIDVPLDEISYLCAGINHMAFYLRFERVTADGLIDLYPRIARVVAEERVPDNNRVRYDLFQRFGYFVTESSEHFAEYVPWYIQRDRPDLIERYNIPLDEYLRRCEVQIAGWELTREAIERPGAPLDESAVRERVLAAGGTERDVRRAIRNATTTGAVEQSTEYGAGIIHSIETGAPRVVNGNVANTALIDNLPTGCCVEVPCLVDRNGVQPTRVGALPPQLAALMQTNINVQSLTVEAALTRKREHIYHAALLDPRTAAELAPDRIIEMVDALIEAHGEGLPDYR
ncbi:MAG TPA: alpha-glucosidase/alpha-galactosidase [Thermomicrobiales bacterium]|nr:alpha-glucosidase/alpha-galactosidase [Thermomicrobiales bacterium]